MQLRLAGMPSCRMSFRGHGADLLGSQRIRHSCRWWQPYTSALELHLNLIYSLSQGRGYTGGGRRGGAQDRGSGTQGRGRGGGRGGQPGRGRFVHLHVVINAINAINTLMIITLTRSQSFPDQVRLAACMWTPVKQKRWPCDACLRTSADWQWRDMGDFCLWGVLWGCVCCQRAHLNRAGGLEV